MIQSPSELSAITRLFSSAVFRELARTGRSAMFRRLIEMTHLAKRRDSHATVRDAFDSAFAILKVDGLTKFFSIRGGLLSAKLGEVKAVQDVTFDLDEGETLGLVGESGCGKSTLGRAIMRLEEPTAGEVIFEGRSLIHCSNRELFELRPNLQMIFQDPYSSLNPRMTIGEIIREPLEIHRIGARADRTERTAELLESVGLRAEMAGRYPHEFSGGQRQRVGIARTLALKPKLIVADEPLSARDGSGQAPVINQMVSLQIGRAHR